MFERPCLPHETVYVNLVDPCTLQAELIVTTSSGSDSRIVLTSAMGKCGGWEIQFHNASRVVSCAIFTNVCVAHINYLEMS